MCLWLKRSKLGVIHRYCYQRVAFSTQIHELKEQCGYFYHCLEIRHG